MSGGGTGVLQCFEVSRLELDTFATAAFASLVRVLESEVRGHLALLEIHHRAEEEECGFGLDKDVNPFIFNVIVACDGLAHVCQRVGLARAAGVLDADADAEDGRIAVGDDFADAVGGGVGRGS